MHKNIKGLFLLLVFSIQLLPLMQVGSILAQGQLTEEECSWEDDTQDGKELGYYLSSLCIQPRAIDAPFFYTLSADDAILSRFADDIQTPPPNTL